MMHLDRDENRFVPGKLWSLLEMMEVKLKPLTTALAHMQSLAWSMTMTSTNAMMEEDGFRKSIHDSLDKLEAELRNLQLGGNSVFVSIKRVRYALDSGAGASSYLKDKIYELMGRVLDELDGPLVLTLSAQEQHFYNPTVPLFGEDVKNKFESLAYEIDEVGKCMALGRSTAAAFHMLRCLEAAMRAIARSLGIPDPIKGTDRNWGNALKEIKNEIDRRWPQSTRLSGDGPLFEKFHGTLDAMKNPYRNSTMHLEEKYTEAEARSLLEIVRGILTGVAARMDEEGQPKA